VTFDEGKRVEELGKEQNCTIYSDTASRPSRGPTQSPVHCIPGDLSLGVKRQRREDDHSSQSNGELKNAWIYASTPSYALMAWNNFTLP
jgi:hypothetical protein